MHHTTPGSFEVFDKVREEEYWSVDCYDGGEGFSNLKEDDVRFEGINKFLELNKKYHKLQTKEDREIIEKITTPIKVSVANPKYYGSTLRKA